MYTAAKDDTVSTLRNANTNANVRDGVNEAKDELSAVANQAGRKVRTLINNASDEFAHAKETITSQIRSNPVQSSAIALGVGFVLGALFRR